MRYAALSLIGVVQGLAVVLALNCLIQATTKVLHTNSLVKKKEWSTSEANFAKDYTIEESQKWSYGMFKFKHKFNAVRSESDGYKFASKKECKRYQDLKRLKEVGEVLFFLMQTPFHLSGGIKYVCDFQVYWANGDITFEDVKGMKTPIYILKKKQVESHYPIKITEV